MNRKTLLFLFLALLILPLAGLAQSMTVSGKVVSSDDGYGLPGVTIQVKGTSAGTVTDMDGNYTLSANSQGILVFSFVGYKTKEVAIKGKNTINVTLELDSQTLDDVVVTALGIKRQKRELGYATEEIGGELIAKSGSGNIISALSGRSAGVQIINPNGVDGGSSRITIRGNNSIFGDNQPLIVVDGVPMTNEGGVSGLAGRTVVHAIDTRIFIHLVAVLIIHALDGFQRGRAESDGASGAVFVLHLAIEIRRSDLEASGIADAETALLRAFLGGDEHHTVTTT